MPAKNVCKRFVAPVAVALLIGACSSGNEAATRDPTERGDIAEFASLLSGGTSAGYDPADSPRELAAWSELVIEGTIERVQEGRIWGFDDGLPPIYTVVLVLRVNKIHVGSLPAKADDLVYIEFISGGSVKAEAYDRVAPREAPVLAYLRPDPKELPGNPPLRDPDAGRPEGQPLWELTTPQGFFVGDGASRVTQARELEVFEETSIGDFLPSHEQWPTHVGPPAEGEPGVPA